MTSTVTVYRLPNKAHDKIRELELGFRAYECNRALHNNQAIIKSAFKICNFGEEMTDANKTTAGSDYSLWWLLLGLSRVMSKARGRELLKYGITREQAAVLHIVNVTKSQSTPTEISRWLLREPQTVSLLINRMENAGLVKKVRDPQKKPLIRVVTTRNGQKAYKNSCNRQSINEILSVLSPEEKKQLDSYLQRLLKRALDVSTKKTLIPAVFPPSAKI